MSKVRSKPKADSPSVLFQISAPHLCAGLEISGDRCVHAAPILRWAVGKSRKELWEYFNRKGWTAVEVLW